MTVEEIKSSGSNLSEIQIELCVKNVTKKFIKEKDKEITKYIFGKIFKRKGKNKKYEC